MIGAYTCGQQTWQILVESYQNPRMDSTETWLYLLSKERQTTQRMNTPLLSACCQAAKELSRAVKKLSEAGKGLSGKTSKRGAKPIWNKQTQKESPKEIKHNNKKTLKRRRRKKKSKESIQRMRSKDKKNHGRIKNSKEKFLNAHASHPSPCLTHTIVACIVHNCKMKGCAWLSNESIKSSISGLQTLTQWLK